MFVVPAPRYYRGMSNHTTRESWLTEAVTELRALFEREGYEVPEVHVSVGWPHGGRASTIGQCFAGSASEDGVGHVFISPVLKDPVRVLDVLLHELVHAVNHANDETGHGKPFKTIAVKLGLTGKMTATVAGEALKAELTEVAARLGDFPHAALTPQAKGKSRSGKSIKLQCASGEDYVVSISKARLEAYGAPKCPCCDDTMEEA
ncbi:SprT-like protease [Microbacterium phage Dismas]|uniref:SprT-like protease n=2 Tax=Dismasvirus dismas TaxID=2560588 RepID=A0A2H5BFS4_9CAUD|nr:SprT-like domain protein [Microbacterium phage Dismas]AUG84842.1 SprT-like protease [Microbacterium phage Dismas]AVR57206.2 SprT-like protease [Microbacterium phage Kieran]